MSNEVAQLRKALKVVHERSDGIVECYDIGDLDDTEEELLASVLKAPELKLSFPGEADYVSWPVKDFLRQAVECESIAEGKAVSLRTDKLAIQLVTPMSEMAHAVVYHAEPLVLETEGGIKVSLQPMSLPVAVFASNVGAYIDNYCGVVSSYQTVEVDFSEFSGARTEEYERNIVDSYLFELASSHDVVFSKGTFIFEDDEPWWMDEKPRIRLRPLEGHNEGVRLYLAAAQTTDPELRFFSFYKVLEHFGPTVLNLEAHECLRKKLDSPSTFSPNGHFIREVLQISKSFDQRKNDRELIKGVLLKGVDLVGLNSLLPESFRRALTYETPSKDVENYSRDLAERICATRNQVAHAKGSYTRHATECDPDDLDKFTKFVQAAAAEAIRWYNRLPAHQKVDVEEKD